jgi:hypothetical protein
MCNLSFYSIIFLSLFAGIGGWFSGYTYFCNINQKEKWKYLVISGLIAILVGVSLFLLNMIIASDKAWFVAGLLVIILIAGALGGLIGFYLNLIPQNPNIPSQPNQSIQDQANQSPQTQSMIISIVLGVGAALLVPLLLHILTSNLMSEIYEKPEKSFILAGFCLAAAISSHVFINTIIQRFSQITSSGQK